MKLNTKTILAIIGLWIAGFAVLTFCFSLIGALDYDHHFPQTLYHAALGVYGWEAGRWLFRNT